MQLSRLCVFVVRELPWSWQTGGAAARTEDPPTLHLHHPQPHSLAAAGRVLCQQTEPCGACNTLCVCVCVRVCCDTTCLFIVSCVPAAANIGWTESERPLSQGDCTGRLTWW